MRLKVQEFAVPEWWIARLELTSTPAFPKGSPSRSYLVRLPLRRDGSIDEEELAAHPHRATVRRYWPNEADRSGYIRHVADGWAFQYDPARLDCRRSMALSQRIGPDLHVTIEDGPGQDLPFQVVSFEKG